MPYAFKVTAKQNIGGSKGIAKGMSVQCVEKSIYRLKSRPFLKPSKISTESRSRAFRCQQVISQSKSFDPDRGASSAEEILPNFFSFIFNRKLYF